MAGIEYVTQTLVETGFNVVAATTAVLGDHWTGVFVVSGANDVAKEAAHVLEKRHGILSIEPFPAPRAQLEAAPQPRFDLRFDAPNQKGSLVTPLSYLADLKCNLSSVYAHVENRVTPPISAVRMTFTDGSPDEDTNSLLSGLQKLSEKEGWLSYSLFEPASVTVTKG